MIEFSGAARPSNHPKPSGAPEPSGNGLAADELARRFAVDPGRSVVLEAPAGSGKTGLLVARTVNLLARVEQPEEILAITFTNKAATEMRERVLAELAGPSAIAAAVRERDQERGWDLETRPDRLKVQTIDSFAFALARRQPVASGFAAEALVDDASPLYQDAADRLLDRIAGDDPHAAEIADFLALLDNDAARARRFIADALAKRDQWIDAVRAAVGDPDAITSLTEAGIKHLLDSFCRSLDGAFDQALKNAMEQLCRHVDGNGSEWTGWEEARNWSTAAATLLTKAGAPRKRFTRQEGFEPRHRAEKQLAAETAGHIDETGLVPLLALARTLPRPQLDAKAQASLRAIATAFTLAVSDLNAAFAAHGAMDFTELALAANRALVLEDLPTELALALDYRIKHILVDEFQDTSLSQHRLLAALLDGWEPGSGNSFFAVGDPMQSVYRFRDADLRQFLATAADGFEHWPLERLRLTRNFRSAPALIDWCNAVFAGLFGDRTDPVHGAVAFHGTTAAASAKNDAAAAVAVEVCVADAGMQGRAQGEAVADRIEALIEASPDASIGVLVRARAVLDDMLPVWRERGISWQGTDIEPLVDEPVVRDLASLAEVLFVPDRSRAGTRLAWLALLRSPLVGLDLPDLAQVARVGDALDERTLSAAGRMRWRRLLDVLDGDWRSLQPRARIERMWLRLGGADAYPGDRFVDDAERFFELLDSRPALARRPTDLRRQLTRLYAAGSEPGANVEVMTIHRAKGLEFDHVIVPGLEHVPLRSQGELLLWRPEGHGVLMAPRTQRGPGTLYDWLEGEEKEQEANELKRLFYVAATRAATSLTLIGGVEADGDGVGKPPKESMLALLWDAVHDDIVLREDPAWGAERPPRTVSRLPDDYQWTPPAQLPALAPLEAPRIGTPTAPLDHQREVVLGDLLHRELKVLGDRHDVKGYETTARLPLWDKWLARTQLAAPDRRWVADELARQIEGVVADPSGRWLLAAHDEDGRESPFTAMVDGEAVRIRVDRTFVDRGVRWIVEYKSTMFDGGDDDAIAQESHRHRPQLRRYAQALGARDDVPVRTAVYFTALPRLVVTDETSMDLV